MKNPKFEGRLGAIAKEAIKLDIQRVSFPYILEYEKCNANIVGVKRVSFSSEPIKRVCTASKPLEEGSNYLILTMRAEFDEPFAVINEEKNDINIVIYIDNPLLADSKSLVNYIKEGIDWEFRMKALSLSRVLESSNLPKV